MKSSQRHGAVLSPDSYRDITNSTHHFANLPSGRYTRPVRIRHLADEPLPAGISGGPVLSISGYPLLIHVIVCYSLINFAV
ncbi:MAG: hypothetical protein IPP34_11625 [Bacteroidetes bacterium]|nr:hypothetical protein [Bacteroidota bacterium]